MYCRKGVGPRIEPWGTKALTGCSCKDCPSRTTWIRLLLRKKEIRGNIWFEISGKDLSLWKRPACQTLLKALDISNTTARVAPDLFKALAIRSNTTIRRSAVDQKNLEPYWKSEKRLYSIGDPQSYYLLQVFQRLY